jgi:Ni/Co efflux regulator RcnB
MKKIILGLVAATIVAAPIALSAPANADAPDGSLVFKNAANGNASSIGVQSSQIKQNGQFVSGQDNNYGIDQTTEPGSRAALVQTALGH